jgi:hypothetical protein
MKMFDLNKTAIETVQISLHGETKNLFFNGKTVYPFKPSNSKRSYRIASIGGLSVLAVSATKRMLKTADGVTEGQPEFQPLYKGGYSLREHNSEAAAVVFW